MALRYVASSVAFTNGGALAALGVGTNTVAGDLLLHIFYGRATGGNETLTWAGGWNEIFNSVTANYGHLAAAWRIHSSGDYTHTHGNYTSGTTGETTIQSILTLRGAHPTTPITAYTASLSTWASGTDLGSIAAPSTATVAPGDGVIVMGFRFDNVTADSVLTGDNLTWQRPQPDAYMNTNLGSDAGGVLQIGWNLTNVNQTVTAKTIATAGTAQVGAGRMIIVKHRPDVGLIGAGMIPFEY